MAHRYILACFVFIFCWVDGESLYGLKGLSVSLKPAIPSEPVDILWKHNGNKLVEFNGNEEHVYGTFANRITLDWHTAEINITDLRFEDSGNYELEATINNMLHRSSKTLVVIDKVPKPTISCKMNDGSSSNKSGTLECSAESKHSQTQSLLKFEWESHGNVQPGPQLTISLGDEHDDHEYICNVSNPKSSETTTFTAKDCYPDGSSSVALAVGLAVLFLIIFVVLGIACYRKRKEKINDVEKHSQPGKTKGSDQMTAQGDEKKPFLHETTTDQQPDMTKGLHEMPAQGDRNSPLVDETEADQPSEIVEKGLVQRRKTQFNKICQEGGKTNEGKAPPVPQCSELSPESAKKEVPQSDPSVSEKANEPDQADESAEEDKMSESYSTAPEEPEVSDNHNMTAQVKESEPLLPLPAANQSPGMTGLDVTTALGDGNSQNVDEAYQQGPVKEKIKMFGGKKEPAKKENPAVGSANSKEDKMSHQESSAAPEEPELKKEPEKDGEANVAPENTAGEQSENMDKPVSTPEKEPANEEIDQEKDLYTSQQPHSPIQTKTDNEHTNTLQ